MNLKKNRAGFTMVELIIVIAIIAILAGIVFVAINPAKRFAEARNTKRWTDTSNLLDAILKYQVDNTGTHAVGVPAGDGNNYLIGTDAGDCSTATCGVTLQAACKNLTTGIAPDYIGEIPKDLKNGTDAKTLYYISQNTAGRITIGACVPELGATIKITR
ncbi:MAG: prepilin-type N-terminal cleavage/methylation domain-containing protein [Patescibacteria group bacterium]